MGSERKTIPDFENLSDDELSKLATDFDMESIKLRNMITQYEEDVGLDKFLTIMHLRNDGLTEVVEIPIATYKQGLKHRHEFCVRMLRDLVVEVGKRARNKFKDNNKIQTQFDDTYL